MNDINASTNLTLRDSDIVQNPIVFEYGKGFADMFYPHELKNAILNGSDFTIADYEIANTSLIIRWEFLTSLMKERPYELLRHRIREIPKLWPEMLTFEINLFNVFSMTKDYCCFEKNSFESIIINGNDADFEVKIIDRLISTAYNFVKRVIKKDPAQYSLEDILTVFFDHFYESVEAGEKLELYKNK